MELGKFKYKFLGFLLVFIVLGTLSTLQHNKVKTPNDYHSELWADASGYYIYLPMWFKFGIDSENYPKNAHNPGYGYQIDSLNNHIVTKYTCGLALLSAPFYLTMQTLFPQKDVLFSYYDLKLSDWIAAFYLSLGLAFLYGFLRRRTKALLAFFSLTLVFLATNLFYYSVVSTFMPHIYGFAVISALIFFIDRDLQAQLKPSAGKIALYASLAALIFLIRPTNLIFLLGILAYFFFYYPKSFKNWLTSFLEPTFLGLFILCALLIFTPQLIYWNQVHGSVLHYSYGDEGFNFSQPQIIYHLFSTVNGWLLYSPIWLPVLFFGLFKSINGHRPSAVIMTCVLFAIYIFSSWWSWHFGCGFGQRTYIEAIPLLIILLVDLINYLQTRQLFLRIVAVLFALLFCWNNISLSLAIDTCFYGKTWDWQEYFLLSNKNRSWLLKVNEWTMADDFEAEGFHFEIGREKTQTFSKAHSGNKVLLLDSADVYGPGASTQLKWLTASDTLQNVTYSIAIYKASASPKAVLHLFQGDQSFVYEVKTMEVVQNNGPWTVYLVDFPINIKSSDQWEFRTYLYNDQKQRLWLDDLQIKLRY